MRVGQEVVGADGVHLGTVAAVLSGGFSVARIESGMPIQLPMFLVAAVEGARVRLNETAAVAAAHALPVSYATKDGVAATPGAPVSAAAHGPLPPVTNRAVGGRSGRGNFYLPWIVAALGLLLILLAIRGCTKSPPPPPPPAAPVAAADRNPAAATPLPVQTVRLPDGSSVTTEQNSTAFQLVRYLGSDQPAPRTFPFDHAVFTRGGSELTAASGAELDEIAAILRGFPQARLRVTAHADAGRDDPPHDKQGEDRATAIARALQERGVAADRVTAASGDAPATSVERKHDPHPRTHGGTATFTVVAK